MAKTWTVIDSSSVTLHALRRGIYSKTPYKCRGGLESSYQLFSRFHPESRVYFTAPQKTCMDFMVRHSWGELGCLTRVSQVTVKCGTTVKKREEVRSSYCAETKTNDGLRSGSGWHLAETLSCSINISPYGLEVHPGGTEAVSADVSRLLWLYTEIAGQRLPKSFGIIYLVKSPHKVFVKGRLNLEGSWAYLLSITFSQICYY